MDKVRERITARREPFVSRLMERADPDADIRDAFDEARPRSREDIMLDVRLRDGSRQAFSYAYLVRIEYTPKDVIRMQFGTGRVKVEGKCLARLYEAMCEHRVRFVQEGNAAEEALKEEGEAHIDRITVEDEETDPS